MTKNGQSWIPASLTTVLLSAASAGGGCSATIGDGPSGPDGPGSDTSGSAQTTDHPPPIGGCQGHFTVPTRLARIADTQIANVIGDLFGAATLTALTLADPKTREFIPTQDTLNSAVLDRYVQTAEGAMNAVTDTSLATL